MGVRRADLRIGRLAGAAVLIAVTIIASPARAAPSPGPQPAQAAASAAAARVTAQVSIQYGGPRLPATVLVRLQPPFAAGDAELLLSMFHADGHVINRRVLEPIARGVYRIEFPFPSGGYWGYYMRFGQGQAGFVSNGIVALAPAAGTVDSFTAQFRSGLRRAPSYVQPLGYAAFAVIAALALAGVWMTLAWLRTAGLSRSAG
jgi:hypothetical protein